MIWRAKSTGNSWLPFRFKTFARVWDEWDTVEMLKEPVALQIIRATLETIADSQSEWKNHESVWQAFRHWCSRKGKDIALSFEEKPPYFHELQDLYAFGSECCPGLGRHKLLARSGRALADILLRERLPDLVAACLEPGGDVPSSLENLFIRFMEQYSRYLFRVVPTRSTHEVSFRIHYSEPEALQRHLAAFKTDSRESFENSFLVIVAVIDACLEYLLDPWASRNLQHDLRSDVIRIQVPSGTKFNYQKLVETLTRFAYQLEKRHAQALLARDIEHDMILQSPLMRDKWEKIKLASATDELILLRGEPGTGKTFLAERIHEMSARKGRPFIEVGLTADIGVENLVQSHLFGHVKGAFTNAYEDKKGLFALSSTGTIFLDEIGDATPDLQAKLLRVIEKKTFKPLGGERDVTVDVRIIAATNKNLEEMAQDGRFRQDLYHRLNVIQIEMPPLRKRAEEIPPLAAHFVRRIAVDIRKTAKPLSVDAEHFIKSYAWPGNFREFIHVLKYALLFSQGERIEMRDLPETLLKSKPQSHEQISEGPSPTADVIDFDKLCKYLSSIDSAPIVKSKTTEYPWHIDHAKKMYMLALIQHCNGNLRKIASYWDCDSEKTVRALIKELGLWEDLDRARGNN